MNEKYLEELDRLNPELGDLYLLECLEQEESQNVKRSRRVYPRRDPKTSFWYIEYIIDAANAYRSSDGQKAKLFRHHFRMSREGLENFFTICKSLNWFPERYPPRKDAIGRESSPLELLIMGALAVLGGSFTFDSLMDVTFISSQAHREFFDEFCAVGKSKMFERWVKPPTTESEIRKASEPYTSAGVPGAFASADGVRVRLWSCSYSLKHQNTGKEGYPVRTFQLCVGYNGEIFSCTRGFDGKDPDTTISEHDKFFNMVKNNSVFSNFIWTCRDELGNETLKRGAWILVDNGYPDWVFLQCPPKHPSNEKEARWGKMLESLRKDVERVFGILKQRFRVLKFGLTWQRFEVIDDIFHTCCALHNYLLFRDERDLDLSIRVTQSCNNGLIERLYRPAVEGDYIAAPAPRNARYKSSAYLSRRAELIQHFCHQYDNDQVYWPSRAGFVKRRLECFLDFTEVNGDVVNYDMD